MPKISIAKETSGTTVEKRTCLDKEKGTGRTPFFDGINRPDARAMLFYSPHFTSLLL